MQKNVGSQKWVVFAFDETDNTAKTGDSGNITGNLRIDGGAADGVDDANPTELEDGYYIFDLTQPETNGDYILICPSSTTANIQVIGCPAAVWTVAPYHNALSIDSNGRIDVIKIAGTAQTANDNGADINAILTDTNELQTNQGNWTTAVSTTCSDKTGFSLSAAGNTAVIDEFETQSAADPTGFKVNVMEVNGTGQTANDNGADINAILTDTNEIQTDNVPGLIAALNDLSAANVNTEVADVLKTDTLGEPAQGAPGATLSIEDKIAWIYKFLRNKITDDGTDIKVYNDAGAVVDHKAPVSEAAGTVTRGEFVTGP